MVSFSNNRTSVIHLMVTKDLIISTIFSSAHQSGQREYGIAKKRCPLPAQATAHHSK
jgi:hypothetical protein